MEGAQDLRGLKKLVANEFVLGKQLARIKSEIREVGKEQVREDEKEFALTIDIELPRSFSSREEVDTFILKLQQLKDELKPGSKIKVNWQ